jgi:DNA-binding LacI/PurR family transcriptional regulator
MVQGALVDGFIVYSMDENDPLVKTVLARRLPTVLMDHPPAPGVHSVNIDDLGGACQAAELLLSLGHRRFAVITDRLSDEVSGSLREMPEIDPISYYVGRLRLKGYREALEKEGVAWKKVPLYECVDNSEADGAAAMRALLACSPRPTAVLCLTDRLAIGALTAVQEAGLTVPGDISIAGFDDIPLAARVEPPLTTVRQDHREKGQCAAQMLVAMLRGEESPDSVVLPVQLVVRGTTGSLSQSPG